MCTHVKEPVDIVQIISKIIYNLSFNKGISIRINLKHLSICHTDLRGWGLAKSPSCDCCRRRAVGHIVGTCPLARFEGGLNLLHESDDDAVIWLESTATAALAK